MSEVHRDRRSGRPRRPAEREGDPGGRRQGRVHPPPGSLRRAAHRGGVVRQSPPRAADGRRRGDHGRPAAGTRSLAHRPGAQRAWLGPGGGQRLRRGQCGGLRHRRLRHPQPGRRRRRSRWRRWPRSSAGATAEGGPPISSPFRWPSAALSRAKCPSPGWPPSPTPPRSWGSARSPSPTPSASADPWTVQARIAAARADGAERAAAHALSRHPRRRRWPTPSPASSRE